MKKIINWIFKNIDLVVIVVGITTLILTILDQIICLYDISKVFIYISGLIGFIYILYPTYLWFIRRADFDWHLINGHFLRKVVCLVCLMPFVLVSIFYICNYLFGLEFTELYKENSYTSSKDSIIWIIYNHFVDPGNQYMASSSNGRIFTAIIAILGMVLLNGLLVSSIIDWVDKRKDKWINGEVYYKNGLKPEYVIIGGNDIVIGIVKYLLNKIESSNYILIQTSRDIESFRRNLFSSINEKQQKKIVIYYGNRDSQRDIDKFNLKNTKEIFVIGEDTRTDDIESYHDTINMECLKLISNKISNIKTFNKNNKLVCRVMFEYQTTFNILQVTDIDGTKIKFIPFNYYEMWTQDVLICKELENKDKCKYLPLEGFEGIKLEDKDSFVHLVIVGMSRMGVAMAIEAAHLAHYPNFDKYKKRTRITFIDANMQNEKHFFMGRFKELFSISRYRDVLNDKKSESNRLYYDFENYPWKDPLKESDFYSHLGTDFIDIEWEFLNGSIVDPEIQDYLTDAANENGAKLTIAICLPENSKAIAAAAYLPDNVYKSSNTLQILVYQRLNDELLKQINENNTRYQRKLKAFGMASECYDPSLIDISETIGGKINNRYDKKHIEKIINIINSIRENSLNEDTLQQLSKSYSKITDAKLKEEIKVIWRKWFDENPYIDDKEKWNSYGWEGKKDVMTKGLETYINIRENGLNEDILKQLSKSYSKITDTKLKNEIKEIWKNWFDENHYNEDKEDWNYYDWIDKKNKKAEELETYINHNDYDDDKKHNTNTGKSSSAKMWSNSYNVFSMWTKFRCFGINPLKGEVFDNENLEEVAKVEHNRWVVEQLLLRYRPLTKIEQEEVKITGIYSPSYLKNDLKKNFAHLDICSNEILNNIDYNMSKVDEVLVEVLPPAYTEYYNQQIKK